MRPIATIQSTLLFAAIATASACGVAETEGLEGEPGARTQAITCAPSLTAAAITKQLVSVSEPTQLTIELVTITPQPYQLQTSSLSFPAGFVQRSLRTTSCTIDPGGANRCRHEAIIEATTACTGTGSYNLQLRYVAVPGGGCGFTWASQSIPFSLTTESFCTEVPVEG